MFFGENAKSSNKPWAIVKTRILSVMRIRLALALCVLALGQASGQSQTPLSHGAYKIYLILHQVGEEQYDIATNPDGTRTLTTTFEYTDRSNKRTTNAKLTTTAEDRPLSLEVSGASPISAKVDGSTLSVTMRGVTRPVPAPAAWAAVNGPSPFALQLMMMRAWHARGEPKQMMLVSTSANAEPLEIERVGTDSVTVAGKRVALQRYTVNHLMFGKEILWTTTDGDLAALMTFAGGLPLEGIRNDLEPAFNELYRAGVAQEMADLNALGKLSPPVQTGDYAIAGATLIDATGAPPIPDSVVVVRDGRIAAAGPRASVAVPRGLTIVDGKGRTLLPGLWEMHTHASGVEFGPASLASGITTMRDCGGEFDFLVAMRNAIDKQMAVGPRMLLAGLVDAGGLKAFGHVTAESPDEGRAVVRRYHDAGFEQIKLYTFLTPDVIQAISAEAHRLGMTVTGHVPQSVSTKGGIEAGMDQINHLNYVTTMLRGPSTSGGGQPPAVDLNSDAARQAIQFLLDHHTVVDPTASWGEMSGHSREVAVETFEPGILGAPAILDSKFRGMESATTADQMRTRMATTLSVIGALHRAGVPIVPGSDTGLVGFGLHREIELYVQAGMTPMEAIQAATVVSARAMRLDKTVGTIEAGKRADLILVAGDPLKDITVLRNVTRVVTNGRMYDAAALWKSV